MDLPWKVVKVAAPLYCLEAETSPAKPICVQADHRTLMLGTSYRALLELTALTAGRDPWAWEGAEHGAAAPAGAASVQWRDVSELGSFLLHTFSPSLFC